MGEANLVATVTQRRLAGQKGETALAKPYENLVDDGSFVEKDIDLETNDPLGYPDYREALSRAREKSGSTDSVVAGSARIGGHDVELAAFDFSFFGGSMGRVAGERLARALERAAESRKPFVLYTGTGGARMQEGMRSLVQMPKVVAARMSLSRSRTPFIALLGHPTTGGVLASIGALADITYAVTGATIGFAGPRVVERFTGQPLRAGSHTAASALEHGLVDALVAEGEEHDALVRTLGALAPDHPDEAERPPVASADEPGDGWEAVQSARAKDRPTGPDLLRGICELPVELRGDRAGRDDPAVLCCLGRVAGRRAVLIALDRNGAPTASGFRKARRCIELAGRLGFPVVTLVDTPGADPSEDSEAEGVAWAIAGLFEAMLSAPVPVVSVVTGEGGSGGALAFAVGDVLVAVAGSIFSVIGPESAAEILWRDSTRAPEAARLLKVGATSLAALGIADEIIPEPLTPDSIRQTVAYHFDRLIKGGVSGEKLASERQKRWRASD